MGNLFTTGQVAEFVARGFLALPAVVPHDVVQASPVPQRPAGVERVIGRLEHEFLLERIVPVRTPSDQI